MIIVYYPCYNCIDWKLKYMCGYIDNTVSLVSFELIGSLIKRWWGFPSHGHVMSFDNGITSLGEWYDGQDPNHKLSIRSCQFIAIVFCMSSIYSFDHEIMQLTDTGGMPCVYQTSQRNWVNIKILYRNLRGYCWAGMDQDCDLLLRVTERYLRTHSVIQHHNKLCKQSD